MKKLRYLFIIVVGLLFYTMLLGVSYRNIFLSRDQGQARLGVVAKPLKYLAEIPMLIKKYIEPDEFLIPNDHLNLKNNLQVHTEKELNYEDKLLISYKLERYGSQIELIDLNSGKTLKNWKPKNLEIFRKAFNPNNPAAPPSSDSDLYYMHPLMLADSSLVVTSQVSSLLARIDADSNLEWLKNDRIYHHSLEVDHEGNIYSCTRPFKTAKYSFLPLSYDPDKDYFLDDHITKIDPSDGSILFDKSIIQILLENGYENLLLSKGQVNSDPVHLNDIQPALDSTAYWKKGDLLVSLRNLSAIMLYRPETNKVLWIKSGPWYNQHDVDFLENNQILIFGNDVLREESVIDSRLVDKTLFFSEMRSTNNAYVFDFTNNRVQTPFSDLFTRDSIRTYTSGRCDLLKNGDLFIEETDFGRIIIGDTVSKKLEYVQRINKDYISHFFWSRIIN